MRRVEISPIGTIRFAGLTCFCHDGELTPLDDGVGAHSTLNLVELDSFVVVPSSTS